MSSFHKILVPVDFSACGREALRYGVELTSRYDAELHLLHVLDIRYAGADYVMGLPNFQGFEEEMRRHAEAEMEKLASAPDLEGRSVQSSLREGIPSQEILSMAEEIGADLIVMGTHGRTGLEHLVLGSTAERVVRMAPCPVLTVRTREEE